MPRERAYQLSLLHEGWVRVLPELRARDSRRAALAAEGRDEVRIVSQDERRLANVSEKVAHIHGLYAIARRRHVESANGLPPNEFTINRSSFAASITASASSSSVSTDTPATSRSDMPVPRA